MALLSRRATRPIDTMYSEPTIAPYHNYTVTQEREYQILDYLVNNAMNVFCK